PPYARGVRVRLSVAVESGDPLRGRCRAHLPRALRGARAGRRSHVSDLLPAGRVAPRARSLLMQLHGVSEGRAPLVLVNRQTAQTISSTVEVAATRRTRRRGLLGRNGLDPSEALILEPCCAIHTAFMRFAIDVIFVDARGQVLKIVRELPPWRLAIVPRAHAVIEL